MIRQIWFQNRQKIEKIVCLCCMNVAFNLKGRIPLLFYSVKHIHGQFKTYLNSLCFQKNGKNYVPRMLEKTLP
jgi:hypothetical protein